MAVRRLARRAAPSGACMRWGAPRRREVCAEVDAVRRDGRLTWAEATISAHPVHLCAVRSRENLPGVNQG